MESPRRICRGVPRAVVTEEQHYGPRWLCDNDDDDDDLNQIADLKLSVLAPVKFRSPI